MDLSIKRSKSYFSCVFDHLRVRFLPLDRHNPEKRTQLKTLIRQMNKGRTVRSILTCPCWCRWGYQKHIVRLSQPCTQHNSYSVEHIFATKGERSLPSIGKNVTVAVICLSKAEISPDISFFDLLVYQRKKKTQHKKYSHTVQADKLLISKIYFTLIPELVLLAVEPNRRFLCLEPARLGKPIVRGSLLNQYHWSLQPVAEPMKRTKIIGNLPPFK